ncbi:MAG TPA: phosphoribosylformylglycinamidine cyclo-ligase, partial [Firmicutes bacterium]|nr:phosphoribosylformylglycinamidine cyclo-ligase [Bacillota bacterium]
LCLAFALDIHDTIGIDAVAMCVNDILVQGAEPLFFLDYLAVGKLVPDKVAAIVGGVAAGCREAGCALLGGETAEMPGFYPPGEYDLAGFAVGVVEAEKIIDGSAIVPGDKMIGLPSSGLHSNGFSLARKALLEEAKFSLDRYFPELGRTLGEELLTPTKIYVKEVLPLLRRFPIKGLAHITGGGLVENIPGILPPDCQARIQCRSWPVPSIFQLIRRAGRITAAEMYRVFNMGIGLVIIAAPDVAEEIRAGFSGSPPPVIGEIVAGQRVVELVEGE